MTRNVSKLPKRPSYHVHLNNSQHSSSHQQLSNYLSLDLSKEKDTITLPKDIVPQSTSPQTSLKKLGLLLDPQKDKPFSGPTMTKTAGNSLHVSPKGFVESSKKVNRGKTPNGANNSGEFSIISPKELVKKAMSKISSKENMKQEVPRTLSASKRNFPKSLTLSLNTPYGPSEKRNETSKGTITTLEDNLFSMKSISSPKEEKTDKIMKLKKIYHDDVAKLHKVHSITSFTSFDEMTYKQNSPISSQSQTGLGWSTTTKPSRASSTALLNSGETEKIKNQREKSLEKAELTHKKVHSIGQIDLFTKKEISPQVSPQIRPRTNSHGNRIIELKKVPVVVNPSRVSPVSFNHAQYIPERPSSPVLNNRDGLSINTVEEAPFDNEEMLTDDGAMSVTNRDDIKSSGLYNNGNIMEPAANNYIDSQNKTIHLQKVDFAVVDNVKQVQSSLLEKLRDQLESKEFVRREDYEKVIRERIEMEEELYLIKDENRKLKGLFAQMQASGWSGDTHEELREIIVKQQKELTALKKRENAVKKVFKMIQTMGIDVDELATTTEENESLYTEEDLYSEGNKEQSKPVINIYSTISKNKSQFNLAMPNQANNNHIPDTYVADSQYLKEIIEHTVEEVEETMLEDYSQSDHKAPEDDSSRLYNGGKKNFLDAKSTTDSSPLFSSNVMSGSLVKGKSSGKLNLDLTRIAGNNVSTVKSNDLSSGSN